MHGMGRRRKVRASSSRDCPRLQTGLIAIPALPELPAWLEGLMTRPEQIKVMKNDQVEVEQFVRSVSRAAKQGVAG
jgi:hypothetical protein